jgi:O-antigen/teichoic acid export membrane protein
MTTPQERVLSGSVALLGGFAFVTLINFGYNLAVARFLGPVAFGHTTAVYTLLILISAVTLSFQILTAKMVAQQASPEAQTLSYRGFHHRAWGAGLVVSALLALFRNSVNDYLNLRDPLLIVLLAVGALFYVPLGARRGLIQGVCRFRHLALNLVLEGFVRLGGSLVLIKLGYGVRGVIAANAAAVVMAYLFARSKMTVPRSWTPKPPVAFRESLQAAVFFAGQVVINNCDIVVVKHFFPPALAGIYAAVAMVGRVIFASSWAIVSSMFPIAAQTRNYKQEETHGVLRTSLLLVGAICFLFVLVLRLAPGTIWTHLFGPQFETAGGSRFRYLLVLYAVSAGVYSLSVVLIAYEMSRKIANTGWIQLVVGGAVVAGIYYFHDSLAQVVWVQMVLMTLLLSWVGILFLIARFTGKTAEDRIPVPGLRLRREVTEEEVIAEFLRNDLESPEFEPYRGVLDRLVIAPDLWDDKENALRRALFNLRHGSLWRQLPAKTRWFETEIHVQDFPRIRVFPRAHWRKLALGDFGIMPVAQRVLDRRFRDRATETFRAKIDDLREHMERDGVGGAVLLIGQSESSPLTVLDGNHRLVAALLASPESVERLRFFCGLSARMPLCCWYQTNLITLARYGLNMLQHVTRDPRRELEQLLQTNRMRLKSLSY